MKKISPVFIAIFFIALAFMSCSKHSDSNNMPAVASSMKFTANGIDHSFNFCLASGENINAPAEVLIRGYEVTNGKAGNNEFDIELVAAFGSIKAGQTYTAATATGQAGSSSFYLFPNTTGSFVTQPGNPQGAVTITGITAHTISGTFAGKLFAKNDVNGTTVVYTITNGSFVAPWPPGGSL